VRAMILTAQGRPLEAADLPRPRPGPGEVLVKVHACGVCRTDLHVVDGDLDEPRLPLVPGHQIVGEVAGLGEVAGPEEDSAPERDRLAVGDRVGVPWLGGSCRSCRFCAGGRENLCERAVYTGYQLDGGFAEYCVADARFCFPIPGEYPDLQAAPLLCAGLIGYRAYRMALASVGGIDGTDGERNENLRLGLYGFGAAAHILIQVARWEGHEVHAFVRRGDEEGAAFARSLGASWAGSSDGPAPAPLDAAIIFAPVGALVPAALRAVDRGGVVVCAGIHMSDIPAFPYADLWQERVVRSVANLTRRDGEEFLALAPRVPVRTEVHPYPLARANQALDDLRAGRFTGAAVVVVDDQGCRTGR
jgi:propanol-preferring alcohol dehydrogenase